MKRRTIAAAVGAGLALGTALYTGIFPKYTEEPSSPTPIQQPTPAGDYQGAQEALISQPTPQRESTLARGSADAHLTVSQYLESRYRTTGNPVYTQARQAAWSALDAALNGEHARAQDLISGYLAQITSEGTEIQRSYLHPAVKHGLELYVAQAINENPMDRITILQEAQGLADYFEEDVMPKESSIDHLRHMLVADHLINGQKPSADDISTLNLNPAVMARDIAFYADHNVGFDLWTRTGRWHALQHLRSFYHSPSSDEPTPLGGQVTTSAEKTPLEKQVEDSLDFVFSTAFQDDFVVYKLLNETQFFGHIAERIPAEITAPSSYFVSHENRAAEARVLLEAVEGTHGGEYREFYEDALKETMQTAGHILTVLEGRTDPSSLQVTGGFTHGELAPQVSERLSPQLVQDLQKMLADSMEVAGDLVEVVRRHSDLPDDLLIREVDPRSEDPRDRLIRAFQVYETAVKNPVLQ